MTNVIHVRGYERRKKPLPTNEFVSTTRALAAHVLAEREWDAFVGEVLAMELDEALGVLDDPQFSDLSADRKQTMRETY